MIWASDRPAVEVGGTTLDEMVLEGRGTIVDGPSGAVVDAATLRRRAATVAATLSARGIGRGDVIGLLAPNMPAWVGTALGALQAGAALTPLSPLASERELAGQLADAGARLVVTVPDLADRARAAGAADVLPIGPDVLAGGGVPAGADPAATALIPYSSGTTGLPKGVLLTHGGLVTAVRQCNQGLQMTERDTVLALAPFFHIMGFLLTMAVPLAHGATVVTMPRFEPGAFFELIERHRVTCLIVPPPIMPLIAAGTADLSSIEMVACGGAPLRPEVHQAVRERLPRAVIGQGYGLTETGAVLSVPFRDAGGSRPGSVGRIAANTELRVVDPETGADAGAGERGELLARGPQLMAGYLGRPEATAAAIDADGWLHTGDLGYVDGAGDVFVVDRLKELIKVNAFQVAPAELEALLATHPAIADAAVVGRPDDACGEVPVAVVVARAEIGEAELMDWVAERVAPYKRLREIRFADAIPRTPSGKVLRRALATEAVAA